MKAAMQKANKQKIKVSTIKDCLKLNLKVIMVLIYIFNIRFKNDQTDAIEFSFRSNIYCEEMKMKNNSNNVLFTAPTKL
jgi:hypothetical protein